MSVQPYMLISDTVLCAVAGYLRRAVDSWCADWGVASDSIEVECLRAWESKPVSSDAIWRTSRSSRDALWWYASMPDWNLQLRQAMFPSGVGESISVSLYGLADEATGKASLALFEALSTTVLDDTVVVPPASSWTRGAGVLALRLSIGKQSMYVLISQTAVSGIVGRIGLAVERLTPLAAVDFHHALHDIRLRLPLEIGRAEVGLGSLMMLGVGDVIRLDTLADHPMTVMGPAGTALFDAYLGLADQNVALEVVRRDK